MLPSVSFTFSDTKNSDFETYIDNMYTEKLIRGYDDGSFRPERNVSRGEFTKIAWKTLRENKDEIMKRYEEFLKLPQKEINNSTTDTQDVARDFLNKVDNILD